MHIPFTKMHGLGNDFIVIETLSKPLTITSENIAAWGRRDTGIGFDQCLLIEPSKSPEIDFFYRIFNADGSEVGQCGNGARCIARFVKERGLIKKNIMHVATQSTRLTLQVNADQSVSVDMGIPQLLPSKIPLKSALQQRDYQLTFHHWPTCSVHALSVGNPHAIVLVTSLDEAPVALLGKEISEHALFPEQTNVEFMQILTKNHVQLRVYERGCGETRACGSGAVAAVAAGQLFHDLDDNVTVSLPGGDLNVEKQKNTGTMLLRGPASFVYDGMITTNLF